MRTYWIYQERQCRAPWSINLELYRSNHKVFANALVYSEALQDARYCLILEGMHYTKCWQFALHILCEAAKVGIDFTESDVLQLEQSIADCLDDFVIVANQ